MDLVDEVLQHLLGNSEIGDHAVLQGTNGRDVARGATQHQFRLATDGGDTLRSARSTILADRNHRGFVQDDPLATHVNQCVSRAQVDGQIVGEHPEQAFNQHE